MPHPSPTPPEIVWAFRQRFRLSQTALAAHLDVAPATVAWYEHRGGPAWLGYALAGLARTALGASEGEARRFASFLRADGQ